MPDTKPPVGALKAVRVQRGVSYRLEREGQPIGLALAFSSGRWGLFDLNEQRICPGTFPTPYAVAAFAHERNLGVARAA